MEVFPMRNNDDGCGLSLLAMLAIPLVMIFSSVAYGFVLSVLWGWFIVPVFEIPDISILQAIGLSMVVGFLTYQHIESDKKSDRSLTESVIYMLMLAIIRPAIVLFIGYIVHLFV